MRLLKNFMEDENCPIGIFDSGIGGLTVASAIHKLMPTESLIYFGDTAHLPYGEKAAASIRQYSIRISDFLLERKCKMIVIACNTASAIAFTQVKKHVGKEVPVINVIDPIAQHVAENYEESKIGVIGTKATINSRVYIKRILKMNPSLSVSSLATPLLVPMIEEGYFNNNISQTIINSYLSKKSLLDVEALILGCTHFPLIKNEVERYYNGEVEIVDSAQIVAEYVKKILIKRGLLRSNRKGHNEFYVSDFTESFARSTQMFFGEKLKLQQLRLWD